MISVIIPLYNKESRIKFTLDSVLNQTFQDFEVVIVNDGSTDGSVEAVKKFDDPRIWLIDQPNGGVSAARNRGIAEAHGEFVAFLDADDEWMPDYLETQHRLTEKYPNCDVFATNYVRKYSDGNIVESVINGIDFHSSNGELKNYFLIASTSNPPLWTSAVVVRKTAIEAIGGFPVGVIAGEDLITWAKLAIRYKIAYSTEAKAVFVNDERMDAETRSVRMPDKDDFVGNELRGLLHESPATPGLKAYLALWHKMRCRNYLENFCRREAFAEGWKSMRLKPSAKLAVFMAMTLLPRKMIINIFQRFK